MENETPSATKPRILVKEKRSFNWLVLALLVIVIVIGTASLMQLL